MLLYYSVVLYILIHGSNVFIASTLHAVRYLRWLAECRLSNALRARLLIPYSTVRSCTRIWHSVINEMAEYSRARRYLFFCNLGRNILAVYYYRLDIVVHILFFA